MFDNYGFKNLSLILNPMHTLNKEFKRVLRFLNQFVLSQYHWLLTNLKTKEKIIKETIIKIKKYDSKDNYDTKHEK